MSAAAILDSWIFLNFKFVTDQTATRAELRHPVSLKSLKLRPMAIFRFFKMRAAAMLNF